MEVKIQNDLTLVQFASQFQAHLQDQILGVKDEKTLVVMDGPEDIPMGLMFRNKEISPVGDDIYWFTAGTNGSSYAFFGSDAKETVERCSGGSEGTTGGPDGFGGTVGNEVLTLPPRIIHPTVTVTHYDF